MQIVPWRAESIVFTKQLPQKVYWFSLFREAILLTWSVGAMQQLPSIITFYWTPPPLRLLFGAIRALCSWKMVLFAVRNLHLQSPQATPHWIVLLIVPFRRIGILRCALWLLSPLYSFGFCAFCSHFYYHEGMLSTK